MLAAIDRYRFTLDPQLLSVGAIVEFIAELAEDKRKFKQLFIGSKF